MDNSVTASVLSLNGVKICSKKPIVKIVSRILARRFTTSPVVAAKLAVLFPFTVFMGCLEDGSGACGRVSTAPMSGHHCSNWRERHDPDILYGRGGLRLL